MVARLETTELQDNNSLGEKQMHSIKHGKRGPGMGS